MAENKIDENSLSEPFEKLNELPTTDIKETDKDEAKKIFAAVVDSVMAGHSVSIAEYNALSRVHKLYDFQDFFAKLKEEKQNAFVKSFTDAGNRKTAQKQNENQGKPDEKQEKKQEKKQGKEPNVDAKTKALNSLTRPIKATSIQDLKKELKKRIETLNKALLKEDTTFTPEQVKQLQGFLETFRTNPKTKDKLNVDKLFNDVINPEKGKSTATPAFAALYDQVRPLTKEEKEAAEKKALADQEIVNTLADALKSAGVAMARVDKMNQLSPTERFAVTQMSKHFKDDDKKLDTFLDLAIQTKEEKPHSFSEFVNTLMDKTKESAKENDTFTSEEINRMENVSNSLEQIKENMVKNKLEPILNKGIDKFTEADLEMLKGLSFLGIEEGRISDALSQHQSWLDSQQPENETGDQGKGNEDEGKGNGDEEQNQPPVTVNEQEINDFVKEVKESDTEQAYLADIDPKISKEAILAALSLEGRYATIIDEDTGKEKIVRDEDGNPAMTLESAAAQRATALGSASNMLVAYDYLEKSYKGDDKEARIAALKEAINYNLTECKPEDINPENAFALLTLAEKVKDEKTAFNGEETYKKFTENLGVSLKTYDLEYFGEPLLVNGIPENKKEQAARLEKNYTESLTALEELDSTKTLDLLKGYTFTDNDGKKLENKNRSWLNPKRLVKGDGNALLDTQESIIEAARLMVAKDLAKNGLPKDITDKDGKVIKSTADQLLEKMQEKINQIMTPTIDDEVLKGIDAALIKRGVKEDDPNLADKRKQFIERMQKGDEHAIEDVADVLARQELGLPLTGEIDKDKKKAYKKAVKINIKDIKANVLYTSDNVGARLGAAMVEGPETFKTRVNQKYKGSKFAQTVQGKWETVDKKLENSKYFGKAYIMAKKLTKEYGGTVLGAAKGALIMGVAAKVSPALVSGLIVYNTVKQWKSMRKELSDPAMSKKEKAAIIFTGAVTTSLGAMAAVSGMSGILDNPAVTQLASNAIVAIGAGRIALSTLAMSTPNLIKKWTLHRKSKKLEKKIKEEKDPKKLSALVEEQKKLEIAKDKNNKDLIKKGLGTLIGLTVSSVVSAHTNTENTDSSDNPDAKPDELNGKTDPNASQDETKTETETKTDAELKAEAEAKAAEELKAKNLEAASEKGSGWRGHSDMESMQKDMDMYGAKLGYNQEQAAAVMKAMGENFGDNSYEAIHASLAEPSILADKMGITAEVEAFAKEANIDLQHNYSRAVLDYLSQHPEAQNNEGFKAYVAEHFDSQDRFHSSNYQTVHQAPHAPHTPQAQPAAAPVAEPAPQGRGFTLTPVDRVPEPQVQQQPEARVVYTTTAPQQPVIHHQQSNLIYDPELSINVDHHEYKGAYLNYEKVDAYGRPSVTYLPSDPVHGKPITVSMEDATKMAEHPGGDTRGIYRGHAEINNPEKGYYGSYGHPRSVYGSGVLVHTTVSTQDVSFGKQLGQYAAARATDIALNEGSHALHHLVDKWTRHH